MFLTLAEEEFSNGAMLPVCDKAWDAVAHWREVNRIAERMAARMRRRFADKRQAASGLSSDPAEYRKRFVTVEFFHVNYFGETPDETDGRLAISDAKLLIKVLDDVDSHMSS